jgi:hypothetical protein
MHKTWSHSVPGKYLLRIKTIHARACITAGGCSVILRKWYACYLSCRKRSINTVSGKLQNQLIYVNSILLTTTYIALYDYVGVPLHVDFTCGKFQDTTCHFCFTKCNTYTCTRRKVVYNGVNARVSVTPMGGSYCLLETQITSPSVQGCYYQSTTLYVLPSRSKNRTYCPQTYITMCMKVHGNIFLRAVHTNNIHRSSRRCNMWP